MRNTGSPQETEKILRQADSGTGKRADPASSVLGMPQIVSIQAERR
jgi:hypothetical protein